eukprot:TRINITY_DN95315_c0_g1_i1.p1 TRINITY_DN95315_c0_g1~~TRINITY_DN95315_c0_g1_i1.p1  ORF type:complete len:175 (-),score=18.84 TRINITY_DN95315_c0_g1_i1:10-483(-)
MGVTMMVTGRVTATDVDGDVLTYTAGAAPAHGTVVVNPNGTYTYTPDPNYNGADHFTILVDDGHGGLIALPVNITVVPVNDPPVAANITQTTTEDNAVSGAVIASDVDGDPLSFTLGSNPLHGTVVVNPNGTYTYTPEIGRAVQQECRDRSRMPSSA